ncbi:MAG: nicotinate (nicotinamide) nucleotide adenylyltransferase [Nitrospirae bacterium]|nr:MAG: nicotinate (nicotinamide) nucleotide adenylyltransferase [Nitrospirota bacterium]
MRIGLFGGTFNPIHVCHVAVAAQCRDRLQLDRVLFIPSGDPPHKPPGSLAPARHRVEMVRHAIAGEPSFSVSEIEVHRTSKSYSIETVRALRTEHGPEAALFFIIGLDAFLDFPTWKEPGELLQLCHFVVVSRPPCAFRSLAGMPLLPAIDPAALAELDTHRRDRVDAGASENAGLTLLALPPCDASASDIRHRLRTGHSLSNLLPASVESYIIQFRLYQETPDRTGVEG